MTAQPSDSPQSDTDETTESPTPAPSSDPQSSDPQSPDAPSAATGPQPDAGSDAAQPDTGAPPEPGAAVEADAVEADEAPAAEDTAPAAESRAAEGPADQGKADEGPATRGVDEVVETPDAYSAPGGDAVVAGDLATSAAPTPAEAPAADAPQGKKKRKKKGKGGGDPTPTDSGTDQEKKPEKKPEKKKPSGPDPSAIVRRIGATSESALAYVKDPDPKLSRMARKHREAVITEIPPVTAGALLGPDALCRHFLASAATGRYRDLFFLWELFVAFPEECKPVLASRQRAQEKARLKLQTATHLGLLGDASRVAADIDRATGLPWRWLRDILEPMDPAIRQRPLVLAAMKRRQPDYDVDLPTDPSDRWLAEAAQLRESGAVVPDDIDALLGTHADRLPATVSTLSMAQTQYPDRVPALIDRVDLQAPDIAAILAWARDHGHGEQLVDRITETVNAAAATDRASGLAAWKAWHERGVDVPLPDSLTAPNLDGLDLGRPESAELIKILVDRGAPLDPQTILDDVAAGNRQLGEKAFEAFVSAGFNDVHLPLALEGNPMVRPETRCPACQAWTWVRPGLEKRCPRDGCPLRAATPTAAEDPGAAVDAAVAALDASAEPASQPEPSAAPAERPAQAPAPRPQAAPPPTNPQAATDQAPAASPDPEPEAAPAAESAAEPAAVPEPEAATPPAETSAPDGNAPPADEGSGAGGA